MNGNPKEHTVHNGFTLYHQSNDSNSHVVIVGDMNEDGIITIEDSQILLDLYSNFFRNSTVDFSVAYVSNCVDANGNPISIDGYVLIIVGDVNEDGLINNADAELLMEYFADYVLAGNNLADYDGIIGTEATVYEVIKVTFPT